MHEKEVSLTENQEAIFNAILLTPRTKEEIARIIGFSVKTVSNNLPQIGSLVKNHSLIRSIDRDGEVYFSLEPHKVFRPKLKNKIYTYARSKTADYIVINLPDPPKDKQFWSIYPWGDIHFGASVCDYEMFYDLIEFFREQRNALVFFTSDLLENSNKASIGAGVYEQILHPQDQQERFVYDVAPIAHMIGMNIGGNHNDRTYKSVYLSPERNVANELELEYFSGVVYIDIICGKYKWEIRLTHGSTHSTTLGGKLNAAMKPSVWHSCDIYLMAHTHDLQTTTDVELVRDPKNLTIRQKERLYMLTGSLYKYWSGNKQSYASIGGLAPTKIGIPRIDLFCEGHELEGSFRGITGKTEFISEPVKPIGVRIKDVN